MSIEDPLSRQNKLDRMKSVIFPLLWEMECYNGITHPYSGTSNKEIIMLLVGTSLPLCCVDIFNRDVDISDVAFVILRDDIDSVFNSVKMLQDFVHLPYYMDLINIASNLYSTSRLVKPMNSLDGRLRSKLWYTLGEFNNTEVSEPDPKTDDTKITNETLRKILDSSSLSSSIAVPNEVLGKPSSGWFPFGNGYIKSIPISDPSDLGKILSSLFDRSESFDERPSEDLVVKVDGMYLNRVGEFVKINHELRSTDDQFGLGYRFKDTVGRCYRSDGAVGQGGTASNYDLVSELTFVN